MSEIDPRADIPPVNWSDLGVSGLVPTGMVTSLRTDVEVPTRRCQARAAETAAVVAALDRALIGGVSEGAVVVEHQGAIVRLGESGDGHRVMVGVGVVGRYAAVSP